MSNIHQLKCSYTQTSIIIINVKLYKSFLFGNELDFYVIIVSSVRDYYHHITAAPHTKEISTDYAKRISHYLTGSKQ